MGLDSYFFPLYFNEEDSDLWHALQTVPAEERGSFVKNLIRKALLRSDEPFNEILQETAITSAVIESNSAGELFTEMDIEDEPLSSSNVEDYSLEMLMLGVSSEENLTLAEPDNSETELPETRDSVSFHPWRLLENVIGKEEDPEVIKLFKDLSEKELPQTELSVQNSLDNDLIEEELISHEYDLESLLLSSGDTDISDKKFPDSEKLPGLNYLLMQIIGEEQDEDVVKILRGTAK